MSKLTLKRTSEQVELIKALASRNLVEAEEAKLLFAEFVGDMLRKYLDLAPTIGNLYMKLPVSEFEPQTLALDDFRDVDNNNYYRVIMQQSKPGGLATNFDYQTDEVPFQTCLLSSAVSMYLSYIRAGRIEHVSRQLNHMANEILKKREITSVSPILYALATEETNGMKHVFRSGTANQLVLDDFVKLMLRASRLLEANVGGTPVGATNEITDAVISPEMLAQIRAMAYEPMNTRGVPNGDESTAVPMTESFRNQIFNNGGIPSFYNVTFHVANELGDNKTYSKLFDNYAGATTFGKWDNSSATEFTAADDLIIAINAAGDSLVKPIITDGETGEGLNVWPDDQFVRRQKKLGYYAEIQEGAVITDTRYLMGLVV